MKRYVLILTSLLILLHSGCGRQATTKEITSLDRKEAASLASEAEFAVTVKDLPRAEKLLSKVVELSPDNGEFWLGLGSVRMRLKDRDGAKRAYESALGAFIETAKLQKENTVLVLDQVHVLALLGRVDDARKLLEKARKDFPEDRAVRLFVQENQLDELLKDPSFKEMSL